MNREPNTAGRITLSLAFYLGMALLLLLVAGGAHTGPPPRPLADKHADPMPASTLPAQVMTTPGSNLYHASASCPFVHRNAQPLPSGQASQRGLAPCPYCIGNSSARLTRWTVAAKASE